MFFYLSPDRTYKNSMESVTLLISLLTQIFLLYLSFLPMLKYPVHSISSLDALCVGLQHNLPTAPSAQTGSCRAAARAGEKKKNKNPSSQFYTTRTSFMFCLGTNYTINSYSLILHKTDLFNSITSMEIKNTLKQ